RRHELVQGSDRPFALDGQPALASGVGERLDAAVVAVAAAIEHGGLHAGGLGPLGEAGPDPLGPLPAGKRLEVRLGPRRRRQRVAAVVVDELGADAAVGAEHGDARALGAAAHLGAHAAVPALAMIALDGEAHARFPTFRATYSPSYRMP